MRHVTKHNETKRNETSGLAYTYLGRPKGKRSDDTFEPDRGYKPIALSGGFCPVGVRVGIPVKKCPAATTRLQSEAGAAAAADRARVASRRKAWANASLSVKSATVVKVRAIRVKSGGGAAIGPWVCSA